MFVSWIARTLDEPLVVHREIAQSFLVLSHPSPSTTERAPTQPIPPRAVPPWHRPDGMNATLEAKQGRFRRGELVAR